MTNAQLVAARKALNPHRATVKLDVTQTGGSETLVPYLIATPATRGPSVVVAPETLPANLGPAISDAISNLLQG